MQRNIYETSIKNTSIADTYINSNAKAQTHREITAQSASLTDDKYDLRSREHQTDQSTEGPSIEKREKNQIKRLRAEFRLWHVKDRKLSGESASASRTAAFIWVSRDTGVCDDDDWKLWCVREPFRRFFEEDDVLHAPWIIFLDFRSQPPEGIGCRAWPTVFKSHLTRRWRSSYLWCERFQVRCLRYVNIFLSFPAMHKNIKENRCDGFIFKYGYLEFFVSEKIGFYMMLNKRQICEYDWSNIPNIRINFRQFNLRIVEDPVK